MFELIINAGSGSQKKQDDLETIKRVFKQKGLELKKINLVEKGSDLPAICRKAADGGTPNIIAAGWRRKY